METVLSFGLFAFGAALVTAMHLHLTGRPPAPVTGITDWPIDDIDAEFFRIIEREGLRESTRLDGGVTSAQGD